MQTLTFDYISSLLPNRPKDTHKGNNGKLLLCVGSDSYIGAALLCAKSAIRAGAGITTVVTTMGARAAFCTLPEAITISTNTDQWNDSACEFAISKLSSSTAIGIGSGIGSGNILPLVKETLLSGKPTVLDADALNQISKVKNMMALIHSKVILTPHTGEMSRLTGLSIDEIKLNPSSVAQHYARQWGCTVLLKDYQSYISNGTHLAKNTTGNSGLAKGGSGDVLCGIVSSLLAQGLEPFDAACAGSYILGASADEALKLLSTRLLNATDVIDAMTNIL